LAIDVGSVQTADILDRYLAGVEPDERMLARNLGLWIVGVEIDLGERAGFRIPSSDQVVARLELEFLAAPPAADNRKLGFERRCLDGGRFWFLRGGRRFGLFDLTPWRSRSLHSNRSVSAGCSRGALVRFRLRRRFRGG
jgi:hypothetical protein